MREVSDPIDVNQQKDNFLAVLGHELRNPVAAITMAAESLRHLCAGDKNIVAMVDIVLRQSAHAARLLDDLLDVSRIANGKIELREERLDLVSVIRTIIADRHSAVDAARLELTMEFPAHPLWVNADPTRIAQVVGNLLTNAVKFTDSPGRISVVVRGDVARNEATIEITDTGVGIEPNKLPQIFEPFQQSKHHTERNREGLGLGLAVAKGLIAMHGGHIFAESEGLGHGTRFVVTLPLLANAGNSAVDSASPPTGSRRVLIIDDSPDVVQSLEFLFSMWGHELLVAYHGKQGIDIAQREKPEIILCDIGLPGMSGYEVAQALRAAPETRSTYLIAVSGFSTAEDKERARAAGFDLHLNKPEGFTTLDRLLRELPVAS